MLVEKIFITDTAPECPYCHSTHYLRNREQIFESHLDFECICHKCNGVFRETWKPHYQSFDPVTKDAYQPEEDKESK
jgi:transposase-like protein